MQEGNDVMSVPFMHALVDAYETYGSFLSVGAMTIAMACNIQCWLVYHHHHHHHNNNNNYYYY